MTNIEAPYSRSFLNSLLDISPQTCPDISDIDTCFNLMKNISVNWAPSDEYKDCSSLEQNEFGLTIDNPQMAKCCRGEKSKSCFQYLSDCSGCDGNDSNLLNLVFQQDDYFTGIYDYGTDPSGIKGKICLTHPFKKKLPNFQNFFIQMAWGLLGILITVIIATCAEFWLKYGESIDCIFYRSRCGNLNKDNKASIIDYVFPDSICYFPYQKCLYGSGNQSGGSKQKGGGPFDEDKKFGFNSNFQEYKANGAKCITLHVSKETADSREFPYNLADIANEYLSSELLRQPLKAISFFALFSNLGGRYIINPIFKKLSILYQDHIEKHDILSTIIYILLFVFYFIIFAFIIASAFFFNFFCGFIFSLIAVIAPKALLEKALSNCKVGPEQGAEYYKLSVWQNFLPVFNVNEGEEEPGVLKKILNFFLNFPIGIFSFAWFMLLYVIGISTSLICCFCQIISFFFYFFYIPLSNNLEFFDLIKNHGILLTLYFCSTVIAASSTTLDIKTTLAMSGAFGIAIIYYFIKYSKT